MKKFEKKDEKVYIYPVDTNIHFSHIKPLLTNFTNPPEII